MSKLGIVVGHNAQAQGAVRPDTHESEFVFNSRIAKYMEAYARKAYPEMETRTFFRRAGPGYSTQIREVYAATDRWGADLTTELHFNATGGGSLMLTSGSAVSMKFAQNTQDMIVSRFNQQDDGISTRRSGRGSMSLITGRAPAILTEPFHGDNREGAAKFDTREEEIALAEAYIDAAALTFDMMPRKDIEESRTIEATRSIRQASNAIVGGGTIGIGGLTAMFQEGIEFGSVVNSVLPYVSIGAIAVVAVTAMVVVPKIAKAIEGFRREDHAKELR